MRILIADGDEPFLDILQAYLWSRGHETETATDGLKCHARLREFRPDVLVLDRELLWGGSDGVLAVMRDDPLKRAIPVILVADSADNLDDSPHQSVVAWLRKPYRLSDLLGQIESDCGPERLTVLRTAP
jgi:CheY-like chemotaxis protein